MLSSAIKYKIRHHHHSHNIQIIIYIIIIIIIIFIVLFIIIITIIMTTSLVYWLACLTTDYEVAGSIPGISTDFKCGLDLERGSPSLMRTIG